MPSSKPDLLLGRPVSLPAHFAPTVNWIENGYIYRYDPACRIVKRSPTSVKPGVSTVYFAVTNKLGTLHRADSHQAPVLRASRRPKFPRMIAVPVLSSMIVAAIALVAYPLMPEIGYRVTRIDVGRGPGVLAASTASTTTEPVSGNRVIIPKIGVTTPILEGSSLKVLDKEEGVWHQSGALVSNMVLAGHRFRYLPPNTSTLFNLDKLTPGDTVAVDYFGKRTVYAVTAIKTVGAKEVSILNSTGKPHLTIYTCTDMRQSKRTVIIAEPLPSA